jgi:integrase
MPAYKDETNGTWYAKFAYKDWTGTTKWTTKRGFATKREAVQYEAEFKLHIAGDMDMTFEEFIKLYREERYPRIRESTQVNKDNIIETKILPFFRNKKVVDIKVTDIVKWQNELLSMTNPKTGAPFSKTYLKSVHNQMNAIMNFAVRFYNLKENPVRKAGSIGCKEAEEMKFWTLDEYKAFSEAIMEDPIAYYCFEVLYWTGLREGELLALTFDDIDLNEKTIAVSKTYQIVKGKETVGPPKTPKGRRVVQIPDALVAELKDYFEMCFDQNTARVFPISKSYLNRKMKKGCKLSGVKKIRVHDLRHSHISLLISLGFTPVDIGNRVGHESITITLRYAHMFPSAQIGMANTLGKLMEE